MSRFATIGIIILIAGVVGFLVTFLHRPTPAEQVNLVMPDGKMTPSFRADFVASFVQSCVEQRPDQLPAAQFQVYCECMSQKGADSITPDEAAYVAANKIPPQSLQDKLKGFAPACAPVEWPKPSSN